MSAQAEECAHAVAWFEEQTKQHQLRVDDLEAELSIISVTADVISASQRATTARYLEDGDLEALGSEAVRLSLNWQKLVDDLSRIMTDKDALWADREADIVVTIGICLAESGSG